MDGKLLRSIIEVTLGCVFLVFFSALPSVPVGLLARWIAKKRGWRRSWPFTAAFFIAVATFFSYDVIITHALAWKFCHGEPNPKTFVLRKVEHPGSIYFEDNVFPGYNAQERLNTIINWLDGVNLTTIAMNDPDGNIHVYGAAMEDWKDSEDIRALKKKGNYYETLDREAKSIAERGKVYKKDTMPKMNYTETFNPVSLPVFWRDYLWSDEMSIVDNATGEQLAYNRRLVEVYGSVANYFLVFGPGKQFCSQEALCGFSSYAHFSTKVFPHSGKMNESKHLPGFMPKPGTNREYK